MKCEHCGETIKRNAKTCPECGMTISKGNARRGALSRASKRFKDTDKDGDRSRDTDRDNV